MLPITCFRFLTFCAPGRLALSGPSWLDGAMCLARANELGAEVTSAASGLDHLLVGIKPPRTHLSTGIVTGKLRRCLLHQSESLRISHYNEQTPTSSHGGCTVRLFLGHSLSILTVQNPGSLFLTAHVHLVLKASSHGHVPLSPTS